MDRRKFLTGMGAVGATRALTISEQAEALEARMIQELEWRTIIWPTNFL